MVITPPRSDTSGSAPHIDNLATAENVVNAGAIG